MNSHLAQIAPLDPEWVKRERRRELRFWASLAIAILAIAGATWAVVVNREQDKQIVQIQHSACQVDAAGKECQDTKREASLAANLAVTCISFAKAGYPCPRPGSKVAERHSKGVVTSNGHAPSSQPGPPSSGPSETPSVSTPPVSESANDSLPEQASSNAEPPGLLTPTTEQLPEPAKPVVEGVCSTVSHAANLC